MSQLVADQILERLEAWGVRRIYGYPGDGINGLVPGLGLTIFANFTTIVGAAGNQPAGIWGSVFCTPK